jgi:hypothetical protein
MLQVDTVAVVQNIRLSLTELTGCMVVRPASSLALPGYSVNVIFLSVLTS